MKGKTEWVTIGFLLPSSHGRSYHVVIEGKPVGLVRLESLRQSLRSHPPRQVPIQKFLPQPHQLRESQEQHNDVIVPIGRR